MVRDLESEVAGDLWIVLDLGAGIQAGEGVESTVEYGVILAASLAERALRAGRAVGLALNGERLSLVPPGRGQGQVWRVLRELAVAEVGTRLTLAETLAHLRSVTRARVSVLAITPSGDPLWVDRLLDLSRSGSASAAVLIDAASFEAARMRASEPAAGVRPLLARAGIPTHVVSQGYPFPRRAPGPGRGHWEFKTTPMGRAIAVRRPEDER